MKGDGGAVVSARGDGLSLTLRGVEDGLQLRNVDSFSGGRWARLPLSLCHSEATRAPQRHV